MGKIQIDFITAAGSPRLTLACGFVIVESPAAVLALIVNTLSRQIAQGRMHILF
jgi:hypothetical protein